MSGVAESVNARVIRRASNATALWVDNRPENNINERRSLEALGLSFVLVTSTEKALDFVAKQKFDHMRNLVGGFPQRGKTRSIEIDLLVRHPPLAQDGSQRVAPKGPSRRHCYTDATIPYQNPLSDFCKAVDNSCM